MRKTSMADSGVRAPATASSALVRPEGSSGSKTGISSAGAAVAQSTSAAAVRRAFLFAMLAISPSWCGPASADQIVVVALGLSLRHAAALSADRKQIPLGGRAGRQRAAAARRGRRARTEHGAWGAERRAAVARL